MTAQPEAADDTSRYASKREFGLWRPLAGVALALGLASTMLPGCNGGPRAGGPTGTVAGRVTIGGQPLEEPVVVTFLGQDGSPATALTAPDGHYELTIRTSRSIPVGHYKIGISPYDPTESAASAPVDPRHVLDVKTGAPTARTQWNSQVPARYGNPATSGLERDVKAGPNEIDLEITN